MSQIRYEEIRKIQVQRLASDLVRANEESMKHLHEEIEEKVDSFSNGDLDHAVDAIVLLWKLSREGVPPATVASVRFLNSSFSQLLTPPSPLSSRQILSALRT